MPNYSDDHEPNLAWEKPEWTKKTQLKATGKADVLKTEGNLAKPITSLPHIKDDGPFEKPGWTGEVKPAEIEGDLAKPITALAHGAGGEELAFEKPGWTKDAGLKTSGKGEALKDGKEIARPIGGIKPVDA